MPVRGRLWRTLHLKAQEGKSGVELEFSAQDNGFQEEVREFLRQNLTDELRQAARLTTSVFTEPEYSLAWQRILHAKGWVAPHWPVEYGGTGWSEVQRYIFSSECAHAGAPGLAPMGLGMIGPCLIGYGTTEQKATYLPRILSGEDYWCQGYSEPGSGSDLASLQMRAVSDGEDYVLNGTKIWTTHAHHANRMFCLVRTNTKVKLQAGITFLLLDMDTPGITVEPIITLAGEHEVNQVFFDDVRVPKSNRLGQEDDGWTVAKYLLEFERGGGSSAGQQVMLRRLSALARTLPTGEGTTLIEDPSFRGRLAEAEITVEGLVMTEHRTMAALSKGNNPGPASSMLKTLRTETMQVIDGLAIELAHFYGAVSQMEARAPGATEPAVGPFEFMTAMPRYLNNRAASIYGGSNEVQRGIMARLVLGL